MGAGKMKDNYDKNERDRTTVSRKMVSSWII